MIRSPRHQPRGARRPGGQPAPLGATGPPSFWPEESNPAQGYDPLSDAIPGASVREKLQHLFLNKLTRHAPGKWRDPHTPYYRALVLKCLYSVMIGFDRQHAHLLPKCHLSSDDPNDFHLGSETSSSSVQDRCCGHVFEKGETYYRCKYACMQRDQDLFIDNAVTILRSSSARPASIPRITRDTRSAC
jgi:hypothetical protein